MKNRIPYILTVFLIYVFVDLSAQESDLFHLWPDTVLAKANSARGVDYMNEEEKQVVYYINLCRTNPKLFSADILTEYLKETGTKKDKVVKELMDELENTQPLLMLNPSLELTEMARAHAKDMGETGRTGHTGTDGRTFKERADVASKVFNGMNENANYGNEKGLDIVIDLLIDRNVPHAGHRKNILDPEMLHIGVAIEPHKRFGFNCVQDFGGPRR